MVLPHLTWKYNANMKNFLTGDHLTFQMFTANNTDTIAIAMYTQNGGWGEGGGEV